MKILLDESLPRKLRNDFGNEHDVWTVRDKGWLGKKNGELLKLMINRVSTYFSPLTGTYLTSRILTDFR